MVVFSLFDLGYILYVLPKTKKFDNYVDFAVGCANLLILCQNFFFTSPPADESVVDFSEVLVADSGVSGAADATYAISISTVVVLVVRPVNFSRSIFTGWSQE